MTQQADAAVVRESLVLPCLFLTVAAAGGWRVDVAGTPSFRPPPLFDLVLATLLVGLCLRSGLVRLDGLVSAQRTGLANVSGALVIASLWLAAAQVFNALTPERGLLNLLFNLVFLILLWNTYAAAPDAYRLLRALQVVFGSALVGHHVVLTALYDPNAGLTKRVLTTLLEGVTLGAVDHVASGPATGYVAFAATLLFVVGLLLVPRPGVPGARLVSGAEALPAHPPDLP